MKKYLVPAFISAFLIASTGAMAKTTLKVAVLTPEGTTWSDTLRSMADEIEKQTNKEVSLKIYFGGSQGDESDVLRKIRVGQLHGGIFTGKTLGDINGDVRVMEIPFTFESHREKALKVMEKLAPYFDKGFASAEFKNLGFFELGLIYFVSQKKTENIDMLKGLKIWSWEGDTLVTTLVKEMNLVSVPLPLPDVLSSLSTGVIEAAYAPPMGIVALQWNTKIKYLVDFPLSYSVGAFLLSNKAWKKIPANLQKTVEKIANEAIAKANISTAEENGEALTAIKSLGVKFLKFPDKDIQSGKVLRAKIIEKLKGKLFSNEALSKFEQAVKDNS